MVAASNDNDVAGIGDEESWTFIGDESDPELVRKIAEWNPERLGRKRSVMDRVIMKGGDADHGGLAL